MRDWINWIAPLLILLGIAVAPAAFSGTIGIGFRVGLNGNGCGFFTIAEAIEAAPATGRNTVYIRHGVYGELLGQTDKNLTFVAASPGGNCTEEDTDAPT